MASFNRVILVGNLTRAPEMRRTATDRAVTRLRLAVSEGFRDRQTGELRESVCYVDVVVWERQAEACNQYLDKGSPVLVEGRLIYEEWKNAQGETRNRLSVRADRVQFLARRDEVGGAQRPPEAGAQELPQQTQAGPEAGSGSSDGLDVYQGAAALSGDDQGSGDDEDLPF